MINTYSYILIKWNSMFYTGHLVKRGQGGHLTLRRAINHGWRGLGWLESCLMRGADKCFFFFWSGDYLREALFQGEWAPNLIKPTLHFYTPENIRKSLMSLDGIEMEH